MVCMRKSRSETFALPFISGRSRDAFPCSRAMSMQPPVGISFMKAGPWTSRDLLSSVEKSSRSLTCQLNGTAQLGNIPFKGLPNL